VSDAVLALGISFDSMLSEQGPTPGRIIAERFALLHPDSNLRAARYHKFQKDFYSARSSVAHGAKKKCIDAAFVRSMASEARGAFRRIIELARIRNVKTEEEYDLMFDHLKWGVSSTAAIASS
jgi:hypothetical protein